VCATAGGCRCGSRRPPAAHARGPFPPAPRPRCRFVANTGNTAATQTLVRVDFNYNGTGPTSFPTFKSATRYTITIRNSAGVNTAINDAFGDIVVDPSGVMYLASSGKSQTSTDGSFYRLDTKTLTTSGTNVATLIKGPTDGIITMQLSYSCDFKTLWGQNLETCNWYTIDPATGVPTFKFNLKVSTTQSSCLRDLGGASCS
jgi:hypothetical protein